MSDYIITRVEHGSLRHHKGFIFFGETIKGEEKEEFRVIISDKDILKILGGAQCLKEKKKPRMF